MFQWGVGVVFQMGGGFSLKGGHPMGGIGFDRGVSKKIVGWGGGASHAPSTIGNPASNTYNVNCIS